MKKLKLNVDELAVASFDVNTGESGRGTVMAHKPPTPTYGHTCDEWCYHTRDGDYTCMYTCNASCAQLCVGTQLTDECGGCQPDSINFCG